MLTSARATGSMYTSRASRSRPSPYSSIRRATVSRSRLATLTNTDRVTDEGAVRTASATIAWLWR